MDDFIIGMIIMIISSICAICIYKDRLRGWHNLSHKGKLLYALSNKTLIQYGFYENVIFLRLGCYKPSEVHAYYWEKDEKGEMHLVLKVSGHPLFEKKKIFIINMNIPKIDVGTVDLILEDHGIKNQKNITLI